MKKIFSILIVLCALTTLATALAPVTVVVRDDGSSLTVKLVDTKSGFVLYSGDINNTSENGSGYSTFVVGEGDPDWGNLSKDNANNSNIVLNIYDNGNLIEQQRIDRLVQESARSAQLPSNVNVSNNFSTGGDVNIGGGLTTNGASTFEGNALFNGEIKVEGAATFKGTTQFKGVVQYTNNTFETRNQLKAIVGNTMKFTSDSYLLVKTANHMNADLPNNAFYTLINTSGDGSLEIEINSGESLTLYTGQHITLFKTNNKFYFPFVGNGL